jgi:pimeloyl-ACP methyl ester carboxylesterase
MCAKFSRIMALPRALNSYAEEKFGGTFMFELFTERFGEPSCPRLLLLHGSGAPPDSLRGYAEALSQDFHVLLPHRNGYSKTGVHDWNPQAEIEALNALTEGDAVVVGHSFGSYRAFQLAVGHPESVSRVLSLGPIAGLPEAAREAVEGLVAFIRSGADLSAAAAARWAAPEYLENNPSFVATCREWLSKVDQEILALENLEVLDGGALMAQLGETKPDVRLYVGSLDAATPPELAQTIASVTGSDHLELVEGMGHSPMVENFDASRDWIRNHAS